MKTMQHRFVDFIPECLEPGIVYISLTYCTAIHHCVCGCGNEVVTPLSPTDWEVTFNGETISLYPSIGNWSFECKSHYFITNGKVKHAGLWSEKRILKGREWEMKVKEQFFKRKNSRKKGRNSNG